MLVTLSKHSHTYCYITSVEDKKHKLTFFVTMYYKFLLYKTLWFKQFYFYTIKTDDVIYHKNVIVNSQNHVTFAYIYAS